MGVAICALIMLLVVDIAKIMIKKMKILPKGLKGTELIFKNTNSVSCEGKIIKSLVMECKVC